MSHYPNSGRPTVEARRRSSIAENRINRCWAFSSTAWPHGQVAAAPLAAIKTEISGSSFWLAIEAEISSRARATVRCQKAKPVARRASSSATPNTSEKRRKRFACRTSCAANSSKRLACSASSASVTSSNARFLPLPVSALARMYSSLLFSQSSCFSARRVCWRGPSVRA